MRKPKQQREPLIANLEQLSKSYAREDLASALEQIQHGLGFKILQGALISEYQNQVLYALENSSKSGKQIEAAYYSGVAQTLLDTATALIPKYIDVLRNKTAVVEGPSRPQE